MQFLFAFVIFANVIGIPVIYFSLLLKFEIGRLDTYTEIYSDRFTELVNSNPKYWQYEINRIDFIILSKHQKDDHETVKILDLNNKIVFEKKDDIKNPTIKQVMSFRDFGLEVGKVVIERSIYPIVYRSVILLIIMCIFAPLLFYILDYFILRRLRNAEHANEQQAEIVHVARLASLGEMSAGVAHEINTPLSTIIVAANLIIKHGNNPEKVQEKVLKIEEACDRITKIVTGLKKFANKTEASKFTNCSLKAIVLDCIEVVKAKSEKNSVIIAKKLQADPHVLCHEIEIQQVVINLLHNAIDATKDSEQKWITVELMEEVDIVILRIIDSGKGIPEAIQQKIFEPFFTTKDIGSGTGLGLSITKGILAQHKASILIDSECPNTCFEIRFSKT